MTLSCLQWLHVTGFRSHRNCRLQFDPGVQVVALIGPNGAGKTNLLEAFSFLAPGRGLRHATVTDVQSLFCQEPWAVCAQFQDGFGVWDLATGLETFGALRRVVKENGTFLKTQMDLASRLQINWLTPGMHYQLFFSGASIRRRFLDRLVFGVDPAHGRRLARYEKALRERLTLLRRGGCSSSWLAGLENILSLEGVAICALRCDVVRRLNHLLKTESGFFSKAFLSLKGEIETQLDDKPAVQVEEWVRAGLEKNRDLDRETGTTALGCHRSDLCFFYPHSTGHQPVHFCSTGEQKAILIAVILAAARLQAHPHRPGFLLLDEIASHLDQTWRHLLLEEILTLRMGVWVTATDSSVFQGVEGKIQIFHVKDAKVAPLIKTTGGKGLDV